MKLNKNVFRFLFLSSFAWTTVSGECVVCRNGIEFPDAQPFINEGLCSAQPALLADAESSQCILSNAILTPTCCPNSLPFVAVGNECGWCPDGITVDVETETEDGSTCIQIASTIYAYTSLCDLVEQSQAVCCPESYIPKEFNCDFCAGGVSNPNAVAFGSPGGQTCGELAAEASSITSAIQCQIQKAFEFACCLDTLFDDPTASPSADAGMPTSSPNDSPTQVGNPTTPTGGTSGCGICGLNVGRSNTKGLTFGGELVYDCDAFESDFQSDLEGDAAGAFCDIALSVFATALPIDMKALCGCEGATPPNDCNLCPAGTGVVSANTITEDGQTLNCGEAAEVMKFYKEDFCDRLFNSNPATKQRFIDTCCGAGGSSGMMHDASLLVALIAFFTMFL